MKPRSLQTSGEGVKLRTPQTPGEGVKPAKFRNFLSKNPLHPPFGPPPFTPLHPPSRAPPFTPFTPLLHPPPFPLHPAPTLHPGPPTLHPPPHGPRGSRGHTLRLVPPAPTQTVTESRLPPLFSIQRGSRGHACPGLLFTRCDRQDFISRQRPLPHVSRTLLFSFTAMDSALSHREIRSVPAPLFPKP